MKPRTLVSHRKYFGLDPFELRASAGRVLTRVAGLSSERARVSAQKLRQDFGLSTQLGEALVHEFVDHGLLKPYPERDGDYHLTDRFVEFAAARVVAPLKRARARVLVQQAAQLARQVNDTWTRNPLEIASVAVSGGYMSRDDNLSELTLNVVVRARRPERRARWGRVVERAEGADEIRATFLAISSFVVAHLVTTADTLPRPFALAFRDDD